MDEKLNSAGNVYGFFARSDWLDYIVLRPLSHIAPNWEIRWNEEERRYQPEPFSFADDLNAVIRLVAECSRPLTYHEHEDVLAERVLRDLNWPIQKRGSRWIGADYASILEQGAFDDLDQKNLVAAAAGRVHAALGHNQKHFDDMEDGHLYMLAALISITIYHRYCRGEALLIEDDHDDCAL